MTDDWIDVPTVAGSDPEVFYNEQLKSFFSIAITSAILYSGGAATALLAIFGESLIGQADFGGPLILVRVAIGSFVLAITSAIFCAAFAVFAADAWGSGLYWNEERETHVTRKSVWDRGTIFRSWAFRFGLVAFTLLAIGSVAIIVMIGGFSWI
jgi:hypothetical protein